MDTIFYQLLIVGKIAPKVKKCLDMVVVDQSKCIFVTFYEIVP